MPDHLSTVIARGTVALMAALLAGSLQAQAPALAPSPEAAYALARQYRGDTGNTVDLRQSQVWLQRAAEGGLAAAQVDVAFIYLSGNNVVPKDAARAFRWFSAAADQGAVTAQCMLGDFHRQGLGGARKDEVQAFRWYSRAAVQDDRCAPKAQYELYVSYEAGRGVRRDLAKAMHWLDRAARGNNPQAQATLARHYEQGHGVTQDLGLAVSWRRRSREGVSHHDDHDHGPPPCPRWVAGASARVGGCTS